MFVRVPCGLVHLVCEENALVENKLVCISSGKLPV